MGPIAPSFSPALTTMSVSTFQPGPGVDIVAKRTHITCPFLPSALDSSFAARCLEHCEFFWIAFQDMMRLLKREGLLFLIAPSSGPDPPTSRRLLSLLPRIHFEY